MSRIQIPADIEYPESDGEPMGETDLHIAWMFRLRDLFMYRYRGANVYVACNLLMYYEEGNPQKFLVPDVFVVKDCDPGMRRTFRIWDEERIPDVVFEVTSKATRADDESVKPERYAQIGVRELVLYDPTGDYLQTQLQLYRLEDGVYVRVESDVNGALESEELNLRLLLDDGDLVLCDQTTGQPLLTHGEAAEALAQAAEARAQAAEEQTQAAAAQTRAAEERARSADAHAQAAKALTQVAESKAAAESAAREKAEAEIRRLREQLKRLGRTD
jgi:Uma2 family endonuclease